MSRKRLVPASLIWEGISKAAGFKKRKKQLDLTETAILEESFLPNFQPNLILETISVWRKVFLSCLFLLIFFGLFLKLFHLQIIQGKENRELADTNRIQLRVIHAPRGVIYDRNGMVLAENNPGFRLKGHIIDRDKALELEAKKSADFDQIEIDSIRYYPLGEMLAHVLGYVGEISSEELVKPEYVGYKSGDEIGRSGIEETYEQNLKGKDGAEIIEIDAQGRKLRTLRRVEGTPGQNLYLSLDADLQKQTYLALKKAALETGSCCATTLAMNPQDGEILSLVSLPSYNNNDFTDPKKNQKVANYFQDLNSPLLNRAIAGVYPPGSTFKITSALAGLSSGKITASTTVLDTGTISLGPYKFSNWFFTAYGKTDGEVNIVKALQRSNDIFFYRLGELVGIKKLDDTARTLGMGRKLGIDLPGEAFGLVPDEEWKQQNIKGVWYPGDTLHLAIGQGYLLVTPLQILSQTAFIANQGNLTRPHLVTKITAPSGETVKEFRYEALSKNIFKKEDIKLVQKGLEEVTKDGGTAWPFFNFSLPTAGKTGTAEFGDPKGRTHAWYTSYAPLDEPKIVITVLIEGGGEGSSIAAPVAKDIYTWYFSPDKAHLTNFEQKPTSSSAKYLGE